jgi:NAD(P)-dependent dehydrogenase (short-subunit alcohol dehydrogenase family)
MREGAWAVDERMTSAVGGSEHGARTGANGGRAAQVARSGDRTAEERVALVSGGNRGLGLQIVRELAGQGIRVVLGSRSVERGRRAIELLGDLADLVAVRQLDVTDAASVAHLASWLGRRLGRCDVLVNNAAVLLEDDRDTAATIDLGLVRRTLETNVLGTWRLAQAVVPLMRAGRYGRIVNVSSDLASIAGIRCGLPAYRISKVAVNALTRMLSDEFAGHGILVNACCPGPARIDGRGDRGTVRLSVSADTAVWLATLPDDGPTGGFYRGRAQLDW